jgi:hypothetical protein
MLSAGTVVEMQTHTVSTDPNGNGVKTNTASAEKREAVRIFGTLESQPAFWDLASQSKHIKGPTWNESCS